MELRQNIKPITYLKTNASHLITKLQETHHPIVITQNGKPKAVLQDIESYERIQKALLMLKLIVQGESDISRGNILENEAVMKKYGKKLVG